MNLFFLNKHYQSLPTMNMHFSELFKISKGKIEPRFKLSFEKLLLKPGQSSDNLDLNGGIELNKHTNSYFNVVLNDGIHNITKVYLD